METMLNSEPNVQLLPSASHDHNTMLAVGFFRYKVGESDIFLEELGENKGKITVSDVYGHNYSMYWGAMGGTLKDFILQINSEYFVNKLLGSIDSQVFDTKATFKNVRKHIREEIGLKWYEYMDFQKQMREVLKDFENNCISCEEKNSSYFIDNFKSSFIDRLDYYLIEGFFEKSYLESDLKNIEWWYLTQTKESPKYKWLEKLHCELKKKLSTEALLN
jgi:elongation factor P--beta-lysine ligase